MAAISDTNRKYYDLTLRSGMAALVSKDELRYVIAAAEGELAPNSKTDFLRRLLCEYIWDHEMYHTYEPRPWSSGVVEDIRRLRCILLHTGGPIHLYEVLHYFAYLYQCVLEFEEIEDVLDTAMEA